MPPELEKLDSIDDDCALEDRVICWKCCGINSMPVVCPDGHERCFNCALQEWQRGVELSFYTGKEAPNEFLCGECAIDKEQPVGIWKPLFLVRPELRERRNSYDLLCKDCERQGSISELYEHFSAFGLCRETVRSVARKTGETIEKLFLKMHGISDKFPEWPRDLESPMRAMTLPLNVDDQLAVNYRTFLNNIVAFVDAHVTKSAVCEVELPRIVNVKYPTSKLFESHYELFLND